MIVPRGVVPTLALLAALLTVSLGFFGGIARAPAAFLGEGDILVLGPPAGGLPGRAHFSARLVEPLRQVPNVTGVSPEIYGLAEIEGRSAFLRGGSYDEMVVLDGIRLVEGAPPLGERDAVVGEGFASAFDVRVGDIIPVPSTFSRVAIPFVVTGIVEADGPIRDEIIVPLSTARALEGVPPDSVHIIRVGSSTPGALRGLLASVEPNFTYSDITAGPLDLVEGGSVTIAGRITNWGKVTGTKQVVVRSGDDVLAERAVDVRPLETVPFSLTVPLQKAGIAALTINPTFIVNVRPPGLMLEGVPPHVTEGDIVRPILRGRDGAPVGGVLLTLGASAGTTDEQGVAALRADTPGRVEVRAVANGSVVASASLFVIDGRFAGAPRAEIGSIQPPAGIMGLNDTVRIRMEVSNGGAPGPVAWEVVLDGASAAQGAVDLPPGAMHVVEVDLGRLPAGEHVVADGSGQAAATFRIFGGRDPRVEAYLERYRVSTSAESWATTAEDPSEYVEDVVGNVSLAVTALSLAAGALASLGGAAVLSRHLAERSGSVGVLKALGATDDQVLSHAAREAGLLGALASCAGSLVGIVAAQLLGLLGTVRAFGHTVQPQYSALTLAIVVLGAAAATAFYSRHLVSGMLRLPADELIRRGSRGWPSPPGVPLGDLEARR